MSEDKSPNDDLLIEGHEYDGIKELDHPLPRWWVTLFYATIIWGVGYWAYYEFLGGPSHQEQYLAAMAKIEERAAQEPQESVSDEDVDLEALLNSPADLKVGMASFKQYCAACHGQNGEGVIGPNLADKYWIHSKGEYEGIMSAIVAGFPAKGMPPWGDVVPKSQQPKLAAYVISLQGSSPANPKEPQGELVE